jgi:hypothetical protein
VTQRGHGHLQNTQFDLGGIHYRIRIDRSKDTHHDFGTEKPGTTDHGSDRRREATASRAAVDHREAVERRRNALDKPDRARGSRAVAIRGRADALPSALTADRSPDRRAIARLLAVLVGDRRVDVADGSQDTGTGLATVQIIGGAGLSDASHARPLTIPPVG